MADSKETKKSIQERRRERKKSRDSDNQRAKSWAREWLDALLFAAIAAIIIRIFLFEAYRIPTPSMEDTLLTGDFLVVSKVTYGPRTPMTFNIPFTSIYLPGVTLPWVRLPGFDDVDRNDIVVFNYPIDIAPISQKTNYVKRCVGIPGDTLSYRDKNLFVNSDTAYQPPTMQKNYEIQVKERVRLSSSKVKSAGGELVASRGNNTYIVNMTENVSERISRWPEVQNVELFVLPENFNEYNRRRFRFSSGFNNHDHMPPVVIPFEGQKVTLTSDNWHIYRDLIVRYEKNDVDRENGKFIINGDTTDVYTIKQNYYFMMGDNRDDSEDSRFWGFVPQDHVVGKAAIIYFSWNHERFLPRVTRMFNLIR